MSDGFELVCQSPGESYSLAIRAKEIPKARHGEVVVKIGMTSVNPIDSKRAKGYGRSLLALMGAGGKSIVLGNDFVGTVQSIGTGVSDLKVGERVFGLTPTGRHGAHASHVVVKQAYVRRLPKSVDALTAVTLPYSFNTMYQCLQALNLGPKSAKGKRVLICGAAGVLGQLATQVLAGWGADVTAICSSDQEILCKGLGARRCILKSDAFSGDLPPTFDATLNFAAWEVDEALTRALKPGALGHATTVHPLLKFTDESGLLVGAVKSVQSWLRARTKARLNAPDARYVWIVFRPNSEALSTLRQLLERKALATIPTRRYLFPKAQKGFELTSSGQPHRAVLIPSF